MRRRFALGFAVAVVATCATLQTTGCGRAETPATVSRFDAVKADPAASDATRWCDAYFAENGPRLALPELTAARPGEPVPSLPAGRPVWVNVWATWCIPCQQEMPLLVRWREALRRDGREVDLVFLSVDEQESELTDFLRSHPDIAPGPSGRFVRPADLDPWLAKLIQPVPAGIPVNVLSGSDGTVRCVRAGSLHDGDYALVRALLY